MGDVGSVMYDLCCVRCNVGSVMYDVECAMTNVCVDVCCVIECSLIYIFHLPNCDVHCISVMCKVIYLIIYLFHNYPVM